MTAYTGNGRGRGGISGTTYGHSSSRVEVVDIEADGISGEEALETPESKQAAIDALVAAARANRSKG